MSPAPLPPIELPSPEVYKTGRWLCFDFETTNLAYGSALVPENRVVLTAWQERGGPVRHQYGNPLEAADFWTALEAADFVIAHNAKFEQHWLARLGYDPSSKLWFDTLLAEKVALGNRRKPLDLGSVSARYGFKGKETLIQSLMDSGVCPSEMPEDKLIARCRRDVRTTAQVAAMQIKRLGKTGTLPVLMTRCLLTPVLVDIERAGMVLDPGRVRQAYAEHCARAVELGEQFKKLTGGINPRSPDQMAVFLYRTLKFPERKDARGRPLRNKPDKPKKDGTPAKWPEGKPRTDQHTLEWLKGVAKTKRQREFIAVREQLGSVMAALSKNLEFFKGVVEERPGARFHGQFNQAATQTHRLSASGLPQEFRLFKGAKSVQFQNMPRAFKRLFTVRSPEYLMVEADGAQLEFRVAAFLGQDTRAMASILDPDFDAHVQTASVLLERDYAELLAAYRAGDKEAAEARQEAKTDTFKPLYGGQKGTPAQERYYRAFQQELYPELYAVQEGWVSQVLGSGRLVTPWGLRFYWDFRLHPKTGAPIDKATGKSVIPSIFNYPVQSLATAEIIPIALWHLYRRVRQAGLRVVFVNTVHDSVIAEAHKDDLAAYKAAVIQAFTHDTYRYLRAVYGLKFNVPLGCEIKAGQFWGEGKGEKVDVEPPTWRPASVASKKEAA